MGIWFKGRRLLLPCHARCLWPVRNLVRPFFAVGCGTLPARLLGFLCKLLHRLGLDALFLIEEPPDDLCLTVQLYLSLPPPGGAPKSRPTTVKAKSDPGTLTPKAISRRFAAKSPRTVTENHGEITAGGNFCVLNPP